MYIQLCGLFLSLFGRVNASDNSLDSELPVGHDVEFLTVPELQKFPTPTEFYENHIKPSKPFVVRAAVNEQNFPAMTKWTDEYLRETYGHVLVPLALNAKRTDHPFKKFLDEYKTVNFYLSHHVEKIGESLLEDIYMVPSLVCGGLQNFIDTAKLWFNGGGPSFQSIVHTDDYENINCIIQGNKRFILVDKAMRDTMEAVMMGDEKYVYGEFGILDADFEKIRTLRGILIYRIELQKGDCLYLPYGWYHQVDTDVGRNIAISTWFYHTKWFNYSDCENKNVPSETECLHKYGLANSNRKHLMPSVLPLYDLKTIQKADFFQWMNGTSDVKEKIFTYLDKDGNSFLSWDELFSPYADKVVEMFPDSFQITLDDEQWDGAELSPGGHDEF